MIIIIKETGITLDLPKDTTLNIEASSPLFSNEGSMSLPINLPQTSNNRRAINFPDRLDLYDNEEEALRGIKDIEVVVKQGSWQRLGNMSIIGCSETTIEVTIYLAESNVWAKIADMTLPQAMAGLHYGPIPERGQEEQYRVNLFNSLFDDFINYPDLFDPREDDHTHGEMSYPEWESMLQERAEWLQNRDFIMAPVHTKDGWLNSISEPKKLFGSADQKYITAFLRLDYVLHKIFEKTGNKLTIDFSSFPLNVNGRNNFFEYQWHSIVLINNTMDALYPGCMYYSALVPEISCKEFLLAVCAQFGCTFVLQSDGLYKMVSSERTLSKLSGTPISQFSDLQLSFNSKLDHSPSDNIEKIEPATLTYQRLPDASYNSYYTPSINTWDKYPNINTISLDGVCQRTTTSSTGGEDSTKSKKCPLIFMSVSFVLIHALYIDMYEHEYTKDITYPALQRSGIQLLSSIDIDESDISHNLETVSFSSQGALYQLLNKKYSTMVEKCDIITISVAMSTFDLANFDFSKALVIKNRLCFPLKLQYKLTSDNTQIVTMELFAPRKIK